MHSSFCASRPCTIISLARLDNVHNGTIDDFHSVHSKFRQMHMWQDMQPYIKLPQAFDLQISKRLAGVHADTDTDTGCEASEQTGE